MQKRYMKIIILKNQQIEKIPNIPWQLAFEIQYQKFSLCQVVGLVGWNQTMTTFPE